MNTDLKTCSREKWIDIYRGLGIILVMIGHTNRPGIILKIIYSFHMPMFFWLSGYLFNNQRTIYQVVTNNLRRLIVPYFKLCLINMLLQSGIELLRGDDIGGVRYLIGILYSRGNYYWMPNCTPLWFLTAQFVALFLFSIVIKLKKKCAQCGLVLLSVLLGYILSNSPSDGWVYLPRYTYKCFDCYPVAVRMVNGYVQERS